MIFKHFALSVVYYSAFVELISNLHNYKLYKHMKQSIILAFLLLAYTIPFAQDSTAKYDPDKAIQFYFGAGGAYNNYKNLNHTLTDAGLPSVGKFTLSSIGEFDLRHKNFLIGFTTAMGFSPKRNDSYNTSVFNFYTGVNAGYYIVNANKFHLAPQLGFGLYSSAAKISQRNGFTDFNDVLMNKNSITLNQNTPVLDFALKFDFADFSKAKTCLTGVRVGYKYGLSKRGWGIDETSNSTVDGSPEDRINQLYAMVTIGFALQKPVK